MLDELPMNTRVNPALPLDAEHRAAIEKRFTGGVVDFLRRIREDHGPEFVRDPHGRLRYDGCRCRNSGCRHDVWMVHCADLISAYTSKCVDLAAETARHLPPTTLEEAGALLDSATDAFRDFLERESATPAS